MNFDVYEIDIECEQTDPRTSWKDHRFKAPAGDLMGNAITKAFLDDDDVQELVIRSFNIGFEHRYRKLLRNR